MLPNVDHPEAFGQHPNADITSQIQETRLLFETLLSLQPQVATKQGSSREDKVSPRPPPVFTHRSPLAQAAVVSSSCYSNICKGPVS